VIHRLYNVGCGRIYHQMILNHPNLKGHQVRLLAALCWLSIRYDARVWVLSDISIDHKLAVNVLWHVICVSTKYHWCETAPLWHPTVCWGLGIIRKQH